MEESFVIEGKEGVFVQTLAQVAAEVLSNGALEATQEFEAERMEQFNSSLAGHIINNFELNKTARRDSGIEEEMLESLRAFNGSYSPSDLAKIGSDGGSLIYMNITSTKCRACASWIKDILMPSNGRAWEVNASVVEDISPELMEEIEKRLEEEFTNFEKAEKEAESKETSGAAGQGAPPPASNEAAPEAVAQTLQSTQNPQESQGAQGSQAAKPPTPASKVAMRLREMNKARRDVKETIREEIKMVAKSEMKDMEKMIEDQLDAGDWEEALSDFVDNFCVYPTAFLKGPIITKRKKCSWNQGQLVEKDDYVFFNKAVNPLDMYPSPSANRIGDGALIEHMRLERKDLVSMKGLGAENGYKDFEIDEILEEYAAPEFVNWWNTDIEDEKATEEARGSSFHSNRNIIHALHFHGPASIKSVRDWGYPESELVNKRDTDEVEIEAILVGNTVIKVLLNDDPMKRRPYYKASFQNRPGSFWGRSLPNLMRSEQRMCNATARALANNMGAAAGPQAEIYIDRLADAGDITEITPFKIWQVTSDPTGAGGRAVTFSTVPSIAAELLSVYKEFELRADDATGIPRYAYGNERTGGAAQTASGLSMLLESASKGIKDAIRHIDHGVIIPRVELQFYWNLKKYPELNYTGDIEVVGKGSAALTIKAAEQGKRMEFLQAIAGNPAIMGVVGEEGMAEIFRTMLQDINIGEILIPSRLELRTKSKEREQAAAQQQQQAIQLASEKNQIGLKATETQIQGQVNMHMEAMKRKDRELDLKEKTEMARSIDKGRELETRERVASGRNTVDSARARAEQEQADLMQRREMAFDLETAQSESPTDTITKRMERE